MDPTSPATFWDFLDDLVSSHSLVIDRPKGSHHPHYPELIYPLDYGYLRGTTSADGGGIDVWVGTSGNQAIPQIDEKNLSAVILTVDLQKNDTEIKIILNCSDEELKTILRFHNDNKMRATLVRRPIE